MDFCVAETVIVKDFKTLSFKDQKEHLLNVARRALERWGYPIDCFLRLLNITENATYLVKHPFFDTMIMRVHRIEYAEYDSIRTELAWLADLRKETDLNLSAPLKAVDGTYVQSIETPELEEVRNVVCFSLLPGKAPQDSQDDTEQIGEMAEILNRIPNGISVPIFRFAAVAYDKINTIFSGSSKSKLTSEDVVLYQKLGEIAATLHDHSKSWKAPDFYRRIEWDYNSTFGEGWNNYYGKHYRDIDHVLNNSDFEAIAKCARLIGTRLEAYGKGPDRYGMIHSDLRMSNLLVEEDKISVIDFDDCGRGWYMYEIACVVGFMEHRPDLKFIIDAIVEGYRKVRPISVEEEREIPTFVMMRRIGLLQAIIYHLDNTSAGAGEAAEISPEIMAFYAKGTVILAKQYVDKYNNIPFAGSCEKERA